MLPEWLVPVGLLIVAALQLALLLRRAPKDAALHQAVAGVQATLDRQGAQLGAVQGEIKAELTRQAGDLSREFSAFTLEQTKLLNETAARHSAQARAEAEAQRQELQAQREAMGKGLAGLTLGTETLRTTLTEGQAKQAATLAQEMVQARELIDRKAEESRTLLDARLKEMREGNEAKLAEIQKSVNEQLQSAVEKQMNESFNRVIDQFTALQKAMGDVQAVTAQIGDLKRLFSNVKARGSWGEAQVRALLDDILPPGGYEVNVRLQDHSADMVEFAIIMPMRCEERVYLPVDAKFPSEDYDRLQLAAEAGDAEGERAARRALETRLRLEAAKIAEKYICPPRTVEFAVLYLPTEGLYAEAARMPGLLEELQRHHHVMVLGPSLLPAMLRTIQLGHVTLALSQNADSIQKLLAATKTEMGNMDEVLGRLAKQNATFGNTLEAARRRTRAVARKLRGVEALESAQAEALLELEDGALKEELA